MVVSNNTISIRSAKLNDISAISAMMAESWRIAYTGIINQEYLLSIADNHWNEFLESTINSNDTYCYVLTLNNEIIGVSVCGKSITEEYENGGELIALYLSPHHLGGGYGHLLFSHAEKTMKENYSRFIICVFSDNLNAINFYTSHGLKIVSSKNLIRMGKQKLFFNIMQKEI